MTATGKNGARRRMLKVFWAAVLKNVLTRLQRRLNRITSAKVVNGVRLRTSRRILTNGNPVKMLM